MDNSLLKAGGVCCVCCIIFNGFRSAWQPRERRISSVLPVASGPAEPSDQGLGPAASRKPFANQQLPAQQASRLGLCVRLYFPVGTGNNCRTSGTRWVWCDVFSLWGSGGPRGGRKWMCSNRFAQILAMEQRVSGASSCAKLRCECARVCVCVWADVLISTVTLWQSGLCCHKPTLHKEAQQQAGTMCSQPSPS